MSKMQKLKNDLSTVKGYYRPPDIRPLYYRFPPKDSADQSVNTSQRQTLFNIPTGNRYSGELGLKFDVAAETLTDSTNANTNNITTYTQSGALIAGSVKLGFRNTETGVYSETDALAFDSTVAQLKAAIEALESFVAGNEVAMTATFDAQFDAGVAVTLTISGSGASTPFTADQFNISLSTDQTSVITISTAADGLHIESGWALIQRLRITHHGTELTNLRECGKYVSIRRLSEWSPDQMRNEGQLEGFYQTPHQKIRDRIAGRTYILDLSSAFDIFKHILPNTKDLSSGPIEVEIIWAPAGNCCTTDNAGATMQYQLSDLEMHASLLDEQGKEPRKVPSRLVYTETYLDQDTVSANNQRSNIKITRSVLSATRLWHVFSIQTNLTDPQAQSKNSSFIRSGMTDYRIRLNGKLWPNNRVEQQSESFRRYKFNSMDYKKYSGTSKGFKQYRSDTTNSFYTCPKDGTIPGAFNIRCESFRIPQLKHYDEFRGNGIQLQGSSDSVFESNKTSDANVLTQFMWIEHDSFLTIDENGRIDKKD